MSESSTGTMDSPQSYNTVKGEDGAEQVGWFNKFWGLAVFILLTGLIIGFPLWWIWGRSPLLPWLKIVLSAALVGLIFVIV
jgi:hypothetical protein